MTRFIKLLYSNRLFGLILILIQLFLIAAVCVWLSDYAYYVYLATIVLSAVLIIYEINRQEEPGFKLTWIMLISVIPIFGAVLYLFLHNNRIARKIIINSKEVKSRIVPYTKQDNDVKAALKSEFPGEVGISEYLYNNSQFPTYYNDSVKYFPIGEDMFADLKNELRSAKDFIFIEMFIINPNGKMWPEILDILTEKAKSGVEVRLMYDGMGCMTLLKSDYPEYLESLGIKCKIFSPIVPLFSTYQNNRDHRKIVIVDGRAAFTGGINFADEYINEIVRFGHWKDNGIKIIGNSVSEYTAMFLQMWNTFAVKISYDDYKKYISKTYDYKYEIGEGFVIPFADSPYTLDRVGENLYLNNINSANEYVHIMTPYLVLGSNMIEALKFAAKRGVDVCIILPHIPDKPYAFWLAGTYYRELISAGVKIYEYEPGFVHAKMSISDGKRAIVGTMNHDYRSLYLNYECAAYLIGVPQINEMEEDFQKTLRSCIHVSIEDYQKRSILKRCAGRIIRLVAPLL